MNAKLSMIVSSRDKLIKEIYSGMPHDLNMMEGLKVNLKIKCIDKLSPLRLVFDSTNVR